MSIGVFQLLLILVALASIGIVLVRALRSGGDVQVGKARNSIIARDVQGGIRQTNHEHRAPEDGAAEAPQSRRLHGYDWAILAVGTVSAAAAVVSLLRP